MKIIIADDKQLSDEEWEAFILSLSKKIKVVKLLSSAKEAREYFGKTKSMLKQHDNASLLINWKDKIIPLRIKDIALFRIEYKTTQAITFTNKKYYIAHTLEELEDICGNNFFRANRQFLINREAITDAEQHFARKLLLNLTVEGDHQVIISKSKVPEFLNWLKGS